MKVIGISTTATWTSATAADTAVTLDVSNYAGALVTYTKTGTVSAGTIVFEFSDDDGTTWYAVKVARLSTHATESSYTLTTGSTSWIANVPGATDFRVRLSVQISGAGTASLRVANLALTTPFPGSSAGGGGGDGAILDGADSGIAATVLDLTNSNPLTVAVTDASGDQISSFGGGTQYTEGDTDASITGTAMLMEVAANALQPVQGTVADGLLVNLGSNNDVTVSGVSTAANQTTIIGHVDGIEGLLTTIAGTDFATETTLSALNAKVTAVNTGAVTISVALPAGTNAIGKLAANDGVDIGDVTINNSSIAVTDNSGSLTVDAPVGTPVFVRLSDGSSAITTLPVSLASVPSHAVTNAGTFAVQHNSTGKTILSAGGSASSSGNNTLISGGSNRLKVFAFSLSTVSTTAVTCIFQSGAGGTELWRVVLQAVSGANTGANLSVTPPAWLFATASATLLNLNLSSAQTVHWSCSYYDEA